jgi:exosortase
MSQYRTVPQASGNRVAHAFDRPEIVGLFALLALSVALWWQPLAFTLKLALRSDAHTHILLILPLSIALIWFERKRTPATSTSGRWLGWILVSTALFVRGVTAWDIGRLSVGSNLSLSMFALVVWWIGSVILRFGVPMFRSLLFPLCCLFLVVPIPDHLLEWITESLQNQSAVSAEILFRATKVPVTRDGTLLSIPGLNIEVAPECSSIRSSTMLFVMVLVLAHLFLRSSWRQVVLVLTAIPLSVAKNAVRIFTIAELATRVDPAYLHGRLHRQGGIIFLVLALGLELLLLWSLRRSEG